MNSDGTLGILAVLLGASMAIGAWGYAAQVEYDRSVRARFYYCWLA